MKMPRYVTVGPHIYTVHETFKKFEVEDRLGECSPTKLEIRIKPNLAESQKRETLWHEVKHAVNELAGLSDGAKEESFVKRGAPLELDVLRRNPELLEYLLRGD